MSANDNTDSTTSNTEATNILLRRQITHLEEENNRLRQANRNQHARSDSHRLAGRAIRRLVALTDKVESIVDEHDRRLLDSSSRATAEQDRLYRCYGELIRWLPLLRKLLSSHVEGGQLINVYEQLRKGAEGARADDMASLKPAVAYWLNERSPPPKPLIKAKSKTCRGFFHKVTGELLCPIEYSWDDPIVRGNIRNLHPQFLVTAYRWPKFLFKEGNFNRENPSEGIFQGDLLLKGFKHIFTSPSSVSPNELGSDNETETESGSTSDAGESQAPSKRQRLMDAANGRGRTRSHVAALLGMKAVQPRAIAYIAVQLRFVLSSVESWRNTDANFDSDLFYNNIVSWFELPKDDQAKARVQETLLWWNRNVFGPEKAADYGPTSLGDTSVAASLAQQCDIAFDSARPST